MGKDNEKITIINCDVSRKVGATTSDLDQAGDNSFHCPATGSWVNLKKNADGKIVCSNGSCDHMPVWLS